MIILYQQWCLYYYKHDRSMASILGIYYHYHYLSRYCYYLRTLGLIIMMYHYTMTTVLWFDRACNTWSIFIPVLSITAIYTCLYRCGCIPVLEHVNELACYVIGYLKTTEATNWATQDTESLLWLSARCVKTYC